MDEDTNNDQLDKKVEKLSKEFPEVMNAPTAPIQDAEYVETDVFEWCNNVVQYVDELQFTLYFFNKNYTPYRAKLPDNIKQQLRGLFLDEVMEYILGGLDKGLIVRGFEEAEQEELVLQRTKVNNVTKLVNLLQWLKYEQHNIETFKESEHDLKRMKGVLVSCSHAELPAPFYIIKTLPSNQIMKGISAWYIKDDAIKPFDQMTALKIPAENQLLVLNQDLFVFNQAKLKSLFGYDAKAAFIAEQKVQEIENKFSLSFADNMNMQQLVKDNPNAIRKLQKINTAAVTQTDMIQHADDLEVGLMTDDNGAIIIMDGKDLNKFVNLLNDDYMESPLTGERYEIIKKKPLKADKEEES